MVGTRQVPVSQIGEDGVVCVWTRIASEVTWRCVRVELQGALLPVSFTWTVELHLRVSHGYGYGYGYDTPGDAGIGYSRSHRRSSVTDRGRGDTVTERQRKSRTEHAAPKVGE